MLHRASVRRLFRNPRHQTAADHKRHQDGKKDSQLQIVRHAFLRVGEGRLSQGRGDYQRLWIDNAAINAAVPRAAVPWAPLHLSLFGELPEVRPVGSDRRPSPIALDLRVHVPGAAHGQGFGSLSSSELSFPLTTKSL
jgi:hypothetical protein